MSALLVHITCPDRQVADIIARSLVEHHLAACVSVVPGLRSVYRWQGAIEQAEEVLLLAKTTDDRLAALKVHVLMLHPYELPEILAVEAAGGLDRYLDWIHAATREEPPA